MLHTEFQCRCCWFVTFLKLNVHHNPSFSTYRDAKERILQWIQCDSYQISKNPKGGLLFIHSSDWHGHMCQSCTRYPRCQVLRSEHEKRSWWFPHLNDVTTWACNRRKNKRWNLLGTYYFDFLLTPRHIANTTHHSSCGYPYCIQH